MFQNTLQRIRSNTDTQTETIKTTLHSGQTQALEELLILLDERSARKAIALFGPARSGKTTLLAALAAGGSQAKRTPEHRKVVCAVIDAIQLPTRIAPWQHLMLTTLDTLAAQPAPPSSAIHDLRIELNELIQHEANNDESATLAAAAFAHHFRAAFPSIMHNAISLSNATLVIAIDNLDRARPDDAAQLLEASKYFLHAPNCATLIGADEAALVETLSRGTTDTDSRDIVRKWMTARIDLRSAPLPAVVVAEMPPTRTELRPQTSASANVNISNIPAPCLQLLSDALQPDTAAVERAAEQWRSAIQAIARRHAEGYDTNIPGTLVAKLVAIKMLSQRLFDAARFDAPLLSTLERYARSAQLVQTSDEWAIAVSENPRLIALFKSPPSFIGVELRDLATALRLIYAGNTNANEAVVISTSRPQVSEPLASATSEPASVTSAMPTAAPAPSVSESSSSTTSIWMMISVAAITFIIDRLVKLALLGGYIPISDWLRLEIIPAGNVFGTGAALGAELLGLALAVLIVLFWGGTRGSRAYSVAFGLIVGGMAANLFDRVAYGAVMNYLHIANLPVFNAAHIALLTGAVLLAYSIMTGKSGAVKSGVEQRGEPIS